MEWKSRNGILKFDSIRSTELLGFSNKENRFFSRYTSDLHNVLHTIFRPTYFSNKVRWSEDGTGKSLTEALLFAEHGENMLCTKIVLNVRNICCTQHILSRFELGIFMY